MGLPEMSFWPQGSCGLGPRLGGLVSTLLSTMVQVSLRGRLRAPRQPRAHLGVKGEKGVRPHSLTGSSG